MGPVGILGTILLGIFAAGSAGLLLLLLVPVQFTARGVFTDQRVDALAGASWGYGLASVQATPREGVVLGVVGYPVYRFHRTPAPKKKPRVTKRPTRHRPRAELRFVLGVIRRVVPSLRLRARLAGRLGTGDPADTATLWGALVAARAVVRGLDTRSLSIDWMEPTIDLEGQVEGRLWPAAILWIAASEYATTRWSHRIEEAA